MLITPSRLVYFNSVWRCVIDPYICCLLQLCCPPAQQVEKLVGMRMKKGPAWYATGLTREAAEQRVREDLELVGQIKGSLRAVLTA